MSAILRESFEILYTKLTNTVRKNYNIHESSVHAYNIFTLLDLCVSSLRRGHANLLCIVPILTDDPRRESTVHAYNIFKHLYTTPSGARRRPKSPLTTVHIVDSRNTK